jgi:hypothetical protein
VLVKFTYAGDANLDDTINVDDYGRIDFNIPLGTTGWFNGDFNYDGKSTSTITGSSTSMSAASRQRRPLHCSGRCLRGMSQRSPAHPLLHRFSDRRRHR